jgi:hypothetical protein
VFRFGIVSSCNQSHPPVVADRCHQETKRRNQKRGSPLAWLNDLHHHERENKSESELALVNVIFHLLLQVNDSHPRLREREALLVEHPVANPGAANCMNVGRVTAVGEAAGAIQRQARSIQPNSSRVFSSSTTASGYRLLG